MARRFGVETWLGRRPPQAIGLRHGKFPLEREDGSLERPMPFSFGNTNIIRFFGNISCVITPPEATTRVSALQARVRMPR